MTEAYVGVNGYPDSPGKENRTDKESEWSDFPVLSEVAEEEEAFEDLLDIPDLPDFPSMVESARLSEEDEEDLPVLTEELPPLPLQLPPHQVVQSSSIIVPEVVLAEAPLPEAKTQPAVLDRDAAAQLAALVSHAISERVFVELPSMIETSLSCVQEDQHQAIAAATEAALKVVQPVLIKAIIDAVKAHGGIERPSLIEATLASLQGEIKSSINIATQQALNKFFAKHN